MGLLEIQAIKANAGKPKEKKVYRISPISKKKQKQLKDQKEISGDKQMDLFFASMRPRLTGTCQCGCGQHSQKNDDTFYRNCICHIFPKRIFKSIATHELNFIERAFWGGCHSVLDDTSMDKWVNMADWEDIKAKFYVLSPLLTKEEKSTKFYTHLETLVTTY